MRYSLAVASFMAVVLTASAAHGRKPGLAPAPNLTSAEGRGNASPAGVPKWVGGISIYPDKICAVGSCDPTFLASDGKPCAADDARAALAKSVSVNVDTITVEETRNGAIYQDKATAISGMKGWESDVVLKESVIEEYWYDRDGVVSQLKGTNYALACIPKDKLGR